MEVRDACICVEYLMHNIDVVHAFKIAQVPTQRKRFMTCRVLAPPPFDSAGWIHVYYTCAIIYVISHHDLYRETNKKLIPS
jgi:hypothetical protein